MRRVMTSCSRTGTLDGVLVQLGPVNPSDVDGWLRFTRRVMCDLRTQPAGMATENSRSLITEWNHLIDEWDAALADTEPGEDFVWRGTIDPDRAEYLLFALQRALTSPAVAASVGPDDRRDHGWFTLHVMQRFIDSLEDEGRAHAEYVEQLRATMNRFASRLQA